MPSDELADLLQQEGRNASRLIFEDELTGIHNRRFLLSYLNHKVRWDSGEDFPLTLLMLDLDHFKQVNDGHGHEAGDQVLIWLADILWSEAAGKKAMPVRYAGDEFMMLVLGAGASDGRSIAERLLERVADTPFELADGAALTPQISIGIATAPGDAHDPRELIHRADTALYYAKRSGRNRAALASEIESDRVFAPAALKRLEELPVAGRGSELKLAAEAVEALVAGHSQFLIFEGAPGMGKTTLLGALLRQLPAGSPAVVERLAGVEQEGFRPYYLAARFVRGLLARREDRGAALLAALPAEERALLSRVLPALTPAGGDASVLDRDEPTEREALFNSLSALLGRALDGKPLLLLIDDLQLADEATLLLLRVMLRKRELPLLVCATCMESTLRVAADGEGSPLEAFCAARGQELGIRKLRLRALTADDIGAHLRGVFPGVGLAAGLEDRLAHVTQGNPLFLVELLRKLVSDGRIIPGGQGWRLEPLEDDYLPRSLEEVVSAEIAALDAEALELLEAASALGEESSLSLLAGASQTAEARVLEFLDQAQALGLVSLDFHLNDETLRFLGKRVLEISYGAIDPARREQLHERVGSYHEGLYQHILGPSASILAYHFKRSANREKAARYERLRLDYSRTVFDRSEAASYTGEPRPSEPDASPPALAPGGMQLVPELLRTFLTAVRNLRLYPAESDAIQAAFLALGQSLERLLEGNEVLVLAQQNQMLHANDQRVDVSDSRLMTASFLQLLSRVDLQAITFHRGCPEEELRSLIRAINAVRPEVLDRGYWRRFSQERELEAIGLKQLGFARVARRESGSAGPPVAPPPALPEAVLEVEDWIDLPAALRSLLGAMRAIRLYPTGSAPVGDAAAQLQQAMRALLERRGGLTFAAVEGELLLNGGRCVPELAPLASRLRQQLESLQLDSLGFSRGVEADEIETAIGAFRQLPPELDRSYWSTFARAHGLQKVSFNQAAYAAELITAGAEPTPRLESGADDEPRGHQPLEASAEAAAASAHATGPVAESRASAEDAWAGLGHQSLLEALPESGRELLLKGAPDRLAALLRRVFDGYPERELDAREGAIAALARLLDSLMPAHQHRLARLALEPLLAALAAEDEPRALLPLTRLLHRMASTALPFSQHALASRIFASLAMRQLELEEAGRLDPERRLLEQPLQADARQLLADDLRSGDSERQQRAAEVLGCLGRPAIPLLVESLKQEKQLRVGLLAASILSGLGPEAGAELRRQMVLEVTVEQRFRIIELVDQVTREVVDELALCIGDPNPKIRRAAFRLAERLRDVRVVDVLIEHARADDLGPAKGALRSLAGLGNEEAVEGLVRILHSREELEWMVACTQALGQTRHPAAIAALARLLGERRHLVFGHRWDDQVRATAAFALAQIDDVRAREALAGFRRDSDRRVREAAARVATQHQAAAPDESEPEPEPEHDDGDREAEPAAAEPEPGDRPEDG